MKKVIITACLTFLITGAFKVANAQAATADTIKQPKLYWFSAGLGATTLGFLSTQLSFNAEIPDKWLITGQFRNEIASFSSTPSENAYNIMAGKVFKGKLSLFSFSAGLGLVNVTTYANYPQTGNVSQYTVGIPILIQGYFVPLHAIGLGINGYVNLNTVRTTAGFNVCLAFGRLSTKHK